MSNKETQVEVMQEVVDISIEKISVLFLSNYETEDIEDLAERVQMDGKMTPLTVIGVGNDGEEYEILTGELRYQAAKQIHEKDVSLFAIVPCIVKNLDYITEEEVQRLIRRIANAGARAENTDKYRFEAVERLHEIFNGSYFKKYHIKKRLAGAWNKSPRYIAMYDDIIKNGSEHLKEAILTKKESSKGKIHITVSTAAKIASLPKEKQEEVLINWKNKMD